MKTYKILLVMFSALCFSSSVNAQWIQTIGLDGKVVSCLAVNGTKLYAGTSDGVFLMVTKRESWKAINNGLALSPVTCLAACDTNLYTGTRQGGVFRTSDNGANWISLNIGVKGSSVTCLAASGSTVFAGIAEGYPNYGASIFRSTNNGLNWQVVDSSNINSAINCMAIKDSTVFAGITLIYDGSVIMRSKNNGNSWDNPTGGYRRMFTCLLIQDSTILAGDNGTYAVLSLSTDNGSNWSKQRIGSTDTKVLSLAKWKTNLYVGTHNGVYQSDDNGDSWIHIGMDNMKVTALAIRGTDLYAGTYNGVWRHPLNELPTSTKDLTDLPFKVALEQNNPNPFTDHTSLHFSLAQKGFVTIKIYDLIGQLVRELVRGTYPSGTSTIDWNGTDSNGKRVNAGIYVGRMTVGNQSKTIKMIVH